MRNAIYGDLQTNKKLSFSWGEVTWLEDKASTPQGRQAFGVVRIKPGKNNPLHYHANCEEGNYIMQGQGRCIAGDETYDLGAGGYIAIPAGIPHTLANVGEQDLHVVVTFSSIDRESISLGSDELA